MGSTNRSKGIGMRSAKFQYESLIDPKYIKDKNELLREHGNGWWIEVGLDRRSSQRKHEHNRRKKLNEKGNKSI